MNSLTLFCPLCYEAGLLIGYLLGLRGKRNAISKYVKYDNETKDYVVIQKGTGHILSHHKTEQDAKDALAAMHVHQPTPYTYRTGSTP